MNYRQIKHIAKESGADYKDLIALSPQNDPFYTGSKAELDKAHWFAELWQRFGYGRGVHLRRIHYQIVSQKPAIIKPNGTVYENTENDWCYLNLAAKYARYLRLVPAESFVDRRNPEAIINAHWPKRGEWGYQNPTPRWEASEGADWGWYQLPDLPELGDLPGELPKLPALGVGGYEGIQQRYHVEVWAEKTTMNDVLIPLCEQYKVNLITGAGELSITAVLDLMDRARDARRPARILYISDYDPAGLGMPISVARKIEYFQREFGYDALDIRLQPIVLTAGQVGEYDLPRRPVKDSDKRKANWIATQGAGQVELDALEALHPGQLAEIVRKAIFAYHDPNLYDRAMSVRRELIWALADERSEVLDRYASELDGLRGEYDNLRDAFAGTRARFAELVAQFQEEIDIYGGALEAIREQGEALYGTLLDDLRAVELDMAEYALPEPNLPDESGELLYSSRRDYFAQLAYYQAYRDGSAN